MNKNNKTNFSFTMEPTDNGIECGELVSIDMEEFVNFLKDKLKDE
jgi:hypothetical protein